MKIETILNTFIESQRSLNNWPFFLFNCLSKNQSEIEVTYYFRNGINLTAIKGEADAIVIAGIWLAKYYNPDEFEIKDGSIIVDIGAHIGAFSVFASTYNKKGKIYAVEPVNKNFHLLEKNIVNNNIKNIEPINYAISNINDKKTMFLCAKGIKQSLYKNIQREPIIGKQIVKTITLERFIKKYKIRKIDFLKIDCEGEEYKILYSCPKNVFKMIDKISLEVHGIKNNNNEKFTIFYLKYFLEKQGFKVNIRTPVEFNNLLYAKKE